MIQYLHYGKYAFDHDQFDLSVHGLLQGGDSACNSEICNGYRARSRMKDYIELLLVSDKYMVAKLRDEVIQQINVYETDGFEAEELIMCTDVQALARVDSKVKGVVAKHIVKHWSRLRSKELQLPEADRVVEIWMHNDRQLMTMVLDCMAQVV